MNAIGQRYHRAMVHRLSGLVLLLLAAAGCAPMQAPPGLEDVAPVIHGEDFIASDGTVLPVRRWEPQTPKAVIVALHGMGDYANAFAMPAPYWAARGIATYAYDQRGFGNAPFPGLWPGGDALRRDVRDFLGVVRTRYPHVPLFVLGSSMGGAVVLSALAEDRLPVDGAILVAPAVWGRDTMPWSYSAALWLTAHLAPDMHFTGKGLKIWPSDNIPMLRAYAADPLVHKRTRADAIWGLVELMDEAWAAPGKMRNPPPILLLYGAHDQVVPKQPTEAFLKMLGQRAEVRQFPDGYHMLLRDLHAVTVWKAVADWIISTP